MADASLRVGIAADHGGFELKEDQIVSLRSSGFHILDLGAFALNPGDDYPDYIIPLAIALRPGRSVAG